MQMIPLSLLCVVLCLLSPVLQGEEAPIQVHIVEPFIDIHTGPASGYPVFHVAEQGEWLSILKRRTSWFKVETKKGQQGWVKQQALQLSLSSERQPVALVDGTFASYSQRDFELATFGGALDGVPSLSLAASWVVNENISTELSLSQALGDFSENQLLLVGLQHYTFPEWRLSPFISLALGQLRTKPRANLVQTGAETRSSDLLAAGLGLRYYLTHKVVIKLEYKSLLALTDRDENEELEQWKLGFAVFF
jgi:hypothetical protein